MNIQDITDAVNSGKPVRWVNNGYHVTRDELGQFHITFQTNQHSIGLTNRAGDKLNGKPEEFYIEETAQ